MKKLLLAAFTVVPFTLFSQSKIEFSFPYDLDSGEDVQLYSTDNQLLVVHEGDPLSNLGSVPSTDSYLFDKSILGSHVSVDDYNDFEFNGEKCTYFGRGIYDSQLYYFFMMTDEMQEKKAEGSGSISIIGARVLSNGNFLNPTVVAEVPVMLDGEKLVGPVVRSFQDRFSLNTFYGDLNEEALLTGQSPDFHELEAVVYLPIDSSPLRFESIHSRAASSLGTFDLLEVTDTEILAYSIGPSNDEQTAWFGSLLDTEIKVYVTDRANENVLDIKLDLNEIQVPFGEMSSWSYVHDSLFRFACLGVKDQVIGVYFQSINLSTFEFAKPEFFGFNSRYNEGDPLNYNASSLSKDVSGISRRFTVGGYNYQLSNVLFKSDGGSYVVWEAYDNAEGHDFEFKNVVVESISVDGKRAWRKVIPRRHKDMCAVNSEIISLIENDDLHVFYFDNVENLERLHANDFEEEISIEELNDVDDGALFHLSFASSGDSVQVERVGEYSGESDILPNFTSFEYDEANRAVYANFIEGDKGYVAVIVF